MSRIGPEKNVNNAIITINDTITILYNKGADAVKFSVTDSEVLESIIPIAGKKYMALRAVLITTTNAIAGIA